MSNLNKQTVGGQPAGNSLANTGIRGCFSIALSPEDTQGRSHITEPIPSTPAERAHSSKRLPPSPSAPKAQSSSAQKTGAGTPEQKLVEKDNSRSYKRYVNARFKYGIDYPSFLVPGPESENGDGIALKSTDGQVEMTVWGTSADATPDGEPWTVAKFRDSSLQDRKRNEDRITYQTSGSDWFNLSGYSKGKIFYFKSMIHDGNVKCFELKYPASHKTQFDPIVAHVARSFKNTQ